MAKEQISLIEKSKKDIEENLVISHRKARKQNTLMNAFIAKTKIQSILR